MFLPLPLEQKTELRLFLPINIKVSEHRLDTKNNGKQAFFPVQILVNLRGTPQVQVFQPGQSPHQNSQPYYIRNKKERHPRTGKPLKTSGKKN